MCPSKIFQITEKGGFPDVVSPQTCIVCGHCVAACGDGAVVHSDFPAEKVHPIDYSQLPTPQQMMLLVASRRSNRAFSTKPVPEQSLEMILDAAHRAPTGSNAQQVSFTLVTDPAKLRVISDFTMGVFEGMLKNMKSPLLRPLVKFMMPSVFKYVPIFERIKADYDAGGDQILRKATAVLLIHAPEKSRLGAIDANLAYQNGSLMAECLGVSQFYTGFVLNAIKSKKGKLEELLGINGTIQAGMALGVPQFRYPNYVDRKDIEVDRQ